MGLCPPRTVLWSLNQSAISERYWNILTVQGGVDPRNVGFLPRLMDFLEMWNVAWTGDGTLYPPEVEMAQHANHMADQKIGRWSWDFRTVRGGIMYGWIPNPCRARVTPSLCMNPV